jgi:SAM-dependent methyltransferase
MTMEVLQDKRQIADARRELLNMGASFVDSRLLSLLRHVGILHGVPVGDRVKSWDVLSTLKYIEHNIKKNEPILDIGCYASEVLVSLHKLGYSNLAGVDLNSNLRRMPYQDSIRYEVADFLHTKFEDSSFRAITSISVIEHGFQGQALLKEMSRLLKPGGIFIASFDYWPEKIDTSDTKFFGMDWLIFSEEDVAGFVSQAADFGLVPAGEIRYGAKERAIRCGGQQYTFAWLVFQKPI